MCCYRGGNVSTELQFLTGFHDDGHDDKYVM